MYPSSSVYVLLLTSPLALLPPLVSSPVDPLATFGHPLFHHSHVLFDGPMANLTNSATLLLLLATSWEYSTQYSTFSSQSSLGLRLTCSSPLHQPHCEVCPKSSHVLSTPLKYSSMLLVRSGHAQDHNSNRESHHHLDGLGRY